MARPNSYTVETGEKICELLVCGDDERPMSLRAICRMEDMPDLKTVMRWLGKNEQFRQQYASARELQQELNYEDIIEISDNSTDDVGFLLSEDSTGVSAKPAIKHSAIARAKLQIDTRKWTMSKMAAKKYGDKQVIAGDPEAPLQHNVTGKVDMGAELIASTIERMIGKNEKNTNDIPA